MVTWTSCPDSQLLGVFTTCVIHSCTYFSLVGMTVPLQQPTMCGDTTTLLLQGGFQSQPSLSFHRECRMGLGKEGRFLEIHNSYYILMRRLAGRDGSKHWSLRFNLPHYGKYQCGKYHQSVKFQGRERLPKTTS